MTHKGNGLPFKTKFTMKQQEQFEEITFNLYGPQLNYATDMILLKYKHKLTEYETLFTLLHMIFTRGYIARMDEERAIA